MLSPPGGLGGEFGGEVSVDRGELDRAERGDVDLTMLRIGRWL